MRRSPADCMLSAPNGTRHAGLMTSSAVGLGGRANGPAREDSCVITAASEVMAILGLATGRADLKQRLARMLVALSFDDKPITAQDLGATGAMAALLKDAIKPNLVQTTENTPALIHTGPFANIAHGTASIIATNASLRLCDWTVIEAGFGSDLGAEKFVDLVAPLGGFRIDGCVLVATLRALKHQGGAPDARRGMLRHLWLGLENLHRHIENCRTLGMEPVVALNRRTDHDRRGRPRGASGRAGSGRAVDGHGCDLCDPDVDEGVD
uniref:Formate--tetrahydrofolate ligase n=1 Tax=candidate division WOR-3 bacterium TaxID=2052148 RepID=A0A7C1WNN4_UNCW3